MRIRVIRPHDVRFMVNPVPVTTGGQPKFDRLKRRVYWSACHITADGAFPHPAAFQFVVAQ